MQFADAPASPPLPSGSNSSTSRARTTNLKDLKEMSRPVFSVITRAQSTSARFQTVAPSPSVLPVAVPCEAAWPSIAKLAPQLSRFQ